MYTVFVLVLKEVCSFLNVNLSKYFYRDLCVSSENEYIQIFLLTYNFVKKIMKVIYI